jgi:hypothetical protein
MSESIEGSNSNNAVEQKVASPESSSNASRKRKHKKEGKKDGKKKKSKKDQPQPELLKSQGSSESPMKSSPVPSVAPAFNKDDLKCVVCLEFPDGQIFQCGNGHLLCTDCHGRIIDTEKPVCPSCRLRMSRDHPSRNLFAESVLANVYVICSNEGCNQKLAFGKLKEHTEKICKFRPASCVYSILGCSWKGIHADLEEHENNCELKNMKGKKIVNLLKERENESKKKVETQRIAINQESQTKVVDLLSSRARDIVIRDVVLEKDELCDVICSKTFMALGYAWEVVLHRDRATKKPSINIRMVSMVRRKLSITFFVLKGPYVEFDIPPVIQSADFKKRSQSQQNCHLVLDTDEETTKRIIEGEQLHLRIGFVDKSRGVSRFFTNQNEDDVIDLSSESDDSEDEEDEENENGFLVHDEEDSDDYDDEYSIEYDSRSEDDSGEEFVTIM